MGDSVEQWRAKTGHFAGGKIRSKFSAVCHQFSSMNFRFMATLILALSLLVVAAGDIETNPGPDTRTRGNSVASTNENRSNSATGTQSTLNVAVRDMGDNSSELTLHNVMAALHRMETTTGNIRDEIVSVKEKVDVCLGMNQQIQELATENKQLKSKVSRLEDMVKRNNLLMMNVAEKERETWVETEAAVREFLYETLKIVDSLDDREFPIDRVQRLGRPRSDSSARAICVQFTRLKHKQAVLDAFRMYRKQNSSDGVYDGTKIRVKEDYCEDVRKIRQKLYTYLERARDKVSNPDKCYMRYDKICIEQRWFAYDLDDDCLRALDGKSIPSYLSPPA
jgi:hypothetical protein